MQCHQITALPPKFPKIDSRQSTKRVGRGYNHMACFPRWIVGCPFQYKAGYSFCCPFSLRNVHFLNLKLACTQIYFDGFCDADHITRWWFKWLFILTAHCLYNVSAAMSTQWSIMSFHERLHTLNHFSWPHSYRVVVLLVSKIALMIESRVLIGVSNKEDISQTS